MNVKALVIASAGLLSACAPNPLPTPTSQPAPGLQLNDLTDDYERIWVETQALPEAERVSHFNEAFAAIIPGFYDAKRLEKFGAAPGKYDELVTNMLADYPAKRDLIAKVAREFQELFAPAVTSFEAAFGPMTGYPPIYLVVSHNEFDGGTRTLPEGTRLLFGADVIGLLHDNKSMKPFFHHELFHLYHARSFPECEKVWCSLWSEGLATHVASSLNPRVGDKALLLTSPVPLRPIVDRNRTEAVCAILARFESEAAADYVPLFAGGGEPLSANLPVRFGYYVGFLVAQDLGRTRTLKELAALDHAEARPLVEQSLRRMAECD